MWVCLSQVSPSYLGAYRRIQDLYLTWSFVVDPPRFTSRPNGRNSIIFSCLMLRLWQTYDQDELESEVPEMDLEDLEERLAEPLYN